MCLILIKQLILLDIVGFDAICLKYTKQFEEIKCFGEVLDLWCVILLLCS